MKMIGKGSLVRYVGKGKTFPPGKFLFVHDAKDGKVVVWVPNSEGLWSKKSLRACEVEEVS